MAKGQRDLKREAYWRKLVTRQRKGGLGVREFCQREGVTESALYAWRRTLAERDAERAAVMPTTRPAFVPVVVRDDPPTDVDGRIGIELSGGARKVVMHLPGTTPVERLVELVRGIEASEGGR